MLEKGKLTQSPPMNPSRQAARGGGQRATRRSKNQTTTLDPTPAAGNYSFVLYLAYVLYPPLYLAGPIMTYPSFVAQLAPPAMCAFATTTTSNGTTTASTAADDDDENVADEAERAAVVVAAATKEETTPLALVAYAVRFLACWVTMELVLHTMYVVALKDSGKGWWNGMTPAQVSLVGFWNLIVVWLKASSLSLLSFPLPSLLCRIFWSSRLLPPLPPLPMRACVQLLLPWRLFRLWSLLDGIVPPENMIRCMANNYSVLGFWRAWHRSYNLWVVRYLYIPLGGSNRPLLATLGVFTFVALWHDLRLRLLVWGWAITLFVVPEMVGRQIVPYSKVSERVYFPSSPCACVLLTPEEKKTRTTVRIKTVVSTPRRRRRRRQHLVAHDGQLGRVCRRRRGRQRVVADHARRSARCVLERDFFRSLIFGFENSARVRIGARR